MIYLNKKEKYWIDNIFMIEISMLYSLHDCYIIIISLKFKMIKSF